MPDQSNPLDVANQAAAYLHKKYRNLDEHDPEAQNGETPSAPSQGVMCPSCKQVINPEPIQQQINLPK